MFLGTPKSWWIGMAIVLVVGLALVGTPTGGPIGNAVGILMIIGGIMLFAAAPMRYGRAAKPVKEPAAPPSPAAIIPPTPPRPRAAIEARDANEV